jgi:hypothetical protein
MPSKAKREVVPGTQGKTMVMYSPDAAYEICVDVGNGVRLADALDKHHITNTTWQKWRKAYPGLDTAYRAAREISAEMLEDKALRLADDLADQNDYTSVKVRATEVAIGQYRWSAERRDAGKFGTKNNVSVSVPVQINTTLDLGDGITAKMPVVEQTDNVFDIEVEYTGELPMDTLPSAEPWPDDEDEPQPQPSDDPPQAGVVEDQPKPDPYASALTATKVSLKEPGVRTLRSDEILMPDGTIKRGNRKFKYKQPQPHHEAMMQKRAKQANERRLRYNEYQKKWRKAREAAAAAPTGDESDGE